MKITFVYLDLEPHVLDWPGQFYPGIGSLSAVLKQQGHETSLIHITQPMRRVEFIERVKRCDPQIIGFSCTSHMFPIARDLASSLSQAYIGVPTICGGIHPTIAPEESIRAEGIDMICRGEGEEALVELCRKMESGEDISDIRNLWIKTDGAIIKNPIRPFISDLDSLPFPDRSIFSYGSLISEMRGAGTFMASRGCPFDCSYCCNHLLRKIYGNAGKPIRFRSVDNLIAEIKQIRRNYPFIKSLVFEDDILFFHRSWSEEFAEKYVRKINLPFECHARADITDDATIDLLKKAGCYLVKFGIESGNEEIRHRVLNRHMTNQQIIRAFKAAKRAGMRTQSYNMIGLPYETPQTILETIKLNTRIDVDIPYFSIYQPYKGTKLGEFCQEKHLVASTDLGPDFFSSSVLKMKSVSSSQIVMFRNYFRVLMWWYKLLGKFPLPMSDMAIELSDRVLSMKLTASFLNLIYPPLQHLYQRVFVSQDNPKQLRPPVVGTKSSEGRLNMKSKNPHIPSAGK